MDSTPPLIELQGVYKTFRDFWRRPTAKAVRGVDLTVKRGEIFGLLGPNGSGKSTIIKMILGLLHPTAGTIRLLDTTPHDIAAKRRIGYLPELSWLHKFLTPRETLHYYAGLFSLPAAVSRQRIEALIEMVGLRHAADRPVGEFSKGMARRVGLAQALINNPDLLILDEPTSGLDPIACREVKDWLRLLAANGKTIFMTSHLLADVEDICDRIAILCEGEVRAAGDVATLLQRPAAATFQVEGVATETLDDLAALLTTRSGAPVTWQRPRIDLESYFLQVVSTSSPTDPAKQAQPADFLINPPANQS